MADAPADRGTTRQPYNRGHEDTVAIQLPKTGEGTGSSTNGQSNGQSPNGQAPNGQAPNGQAKSESNGSSKVLPPMPAQTSKPKPAKAAKAAPAAKPAAKSAPPPPPPAQARATTSAQPGPKPTAPPPQAKAAPSQPASQPQTDKPAPARSAATGAVAAAAAGAAAATITTPAPAPAAPAPTRAQPKVKTPRPAKQPKPAKVKQPKPAKTPAVKVSRPPGRRARLRMTRIDPWSVMKTAFLLSIALGIVTVVSVFMVWSVLDAADVWTSINQTVQGVVGSQEAANFDIEDYVGTRRVVGFTMIVAAVDVVLLTAIATLGAFLYNMSASLLGGVEVTLAEDN